MSEFNPASTDVDVVIDPGWLASALQDAFPDAKVKSVEQVEHIVVSATKLRCFQSHRHAVFRRQ